MRTSLVWQLVSLLLALSGPGRAQNGTPLNYPHIPELMCSGVCPANQICEPNSCGYGNPDDTGAVQYTCQCIPCPTGFVSTPGSWMASQCVQCGPGTFINTLRIHFSPLEAQPLCLPCFPGFYNPYVSQTTCMQCEVGYIPNRGAGTNPSAARSCTPCPAGTMALPGDDICTPCPPGRYQPFQAKGECIDAPLGSYTPRRIEENNRRGTPISGNTQVIPCLPGTFQNRSATFEFFAHSIYSASVGLMNVNGCRRCPRGKFSGGPGKGSCINCPEGFFSPVVGATACRPCPRNTYAANEGNVRCTPCTNVGSPNTTMQAGCGQCVAGSAAPDTHVMCFSCPPGQYAQAGALVCNDCPAGQMQLNQGSSNCDSCMAGSYSIARAATCTPCPAGTYQPYAENSDCITCPVGSYCPLGSTSFTPCDPGFYSVRGSGECLPCQAGTYTELPGMGYCRQCFMGFYQDSDASTGCLMCPAGKYSDIPGAAQCELCPEGSYCPGGGIKPQLCQPGTYTAEDGDVYCPACPDGTESRVTAAQLSRYMPRGSSIGAAQCLPCPPGRSSNERTQHMCMPCLAGTFAATLGSGCQLCPRGRTSGVGATACGLCSPGRYKPGGGPGTCWDCPLGTSSGQGGGYWSTSGCQLCPAGTYGDLRPVSKDLPWCIPCPPGKDSRPGSTSCEECLPGNFAPGKGKSPDPRLNGACAPCPAGSYSAAGGGSCQLCPPGRFAPLAGMSECNECYPGTYGPKSGLTVCTRCPLGQHVDVSGASNKLACEFCLDGTFIFAENYLLMLTQIGYGGCDKCEYGEGTSNFEAVPPTPRPACAPMEVVQRPTAEPTAEPTINSEHPAAEVPKLPGTKNNDADALCALYVTVPPEGQKSLENWCGDKDTEGNYIDDPCDGEKPWTDVRCGVGISNDRIASLDIYLNRLEGGNLPTDLGELAGLSFLRIYDASLKGPIPTELGLLSLLTSLDLGKNELTGQIPAELAKLTRLSTLNLQYNSLDGSIPSELCELPNKQATLQFTYNNFECWPACFDPVFTEVKFTGTLPECGKEASPTETPAEAPTEADEPHEEPSPAPRRAGLGRRLEDPEEPTADPPSEPTEGEDPEEPTADPPSEPTEGGGEEEAGSKPTKVKADSGGDGVITGSFWTQEYQDCEGGDPPLPPADEPPADEPPADEPPADEPPADEPPADEPPADEPPARKLAVACTTCPVGKFSGLGGTPCFDCPAGYFNEDDSTPSWPSRNPCQMCPAGKVGIAAAASSCQECKPGSYMPWPGQTACLPCPAGTYNEDEGSQTCTPCPPGFVGEKEGGIGELSCQACPAGKFQNFPGMTSCIECKEGSVQPGFGEASCILCGGGKYMPEQGQTVCTACAKGTSNNLMGATACGDCQLGTYADEEGQGTCKICAAGKYMPDLASEDPCYPCIVGTFSATSGASICTQCTLGQYQDLEAMTSCKTCAAGFFSLIGEKECHDCNINTYSTAGSSACRACDPRYFVQRSGTLLLGSLTLDVAADMCIPYPTGQPTSRPTGQPSGRPTGQPSMQPTGQPTHQPSYQPSDQPTNQPSGRPTGQPSHQPSGQPSNQPSFQPSDQPTARPTGQPSGQPTVQPSGQPSVQPSGQPSDQPSAQPTGQPSVQPSGQPSGIPSAQPTGGPTNQPTGQPSGVPTYFFHSGVPRPTPISWIGPLLTAFPTPSPSRSPTRRPTWRPSVQGQATETNVSIVITNVLSVPFCTCSPFSRQSFQSSTQSALLKMLSDNFTMKAIRDADCLTVAPLSLCSRAVMYNYHVDYWQPPPPTLPPVTSQPTAEPTSAPSPSNPVLSPTSAPQLRPTSRPVSARPSYTSAPSTARPSARPTYKAFLKPIKGMPTQFPSYAPPTAEPTSNTPTPSPSPAPSPQPTARTFSPLVVVPPPFLPVPITWRPTSPTLFVLDDTPRGRSRRAAIDKLKKIGKLPADHQPNQQQQQQQKQEEKREERRAQQSSQFPSWCFDTGFVRVRIQYEYRFIPGDLGFGTPAQAAQVLRTELGSSNANWLGSITTAATAQSQRAAAVSNGNAKWNSNLQKVLSNPKFTASTLALQQAQCFAVPAATTAPPTPEPTPEPSGASAGNIKSTGAPSVMRVPEPTVSPDLVYVASMACVVGNVGFLNSTAPTPAPNGLSAVSSPEPSQTNTPAPIAWPTILPTMPGPTPSPSGAVAIAAVAAAGISSAAVAGISVGVILVLVVLVFFVWNQSARKDQISKEEADIMQRYNNILARKNAAAAQEDEGQGQGQGQTEAKEESGGDGGALDVRQSFTESIAEIYSPRWTRRDDGNKALSTRQQPLQPFQAYVSPGSEGGSGVNPVHRHMSIQMTSMNHREARLDPSTSTSALDAEGALEDSTVFGLAPPPTEPQREYSFNPLNVGSAANRRASTQPRRASAATTQPHAASDAGPSNSLGMSMQLAGRQNALSPAGHTRRQSAQPVFLPGLTEASQRQQQQQQQVILSPPVAPTPPTRKSVFHKEEKTGPAKFTLGGPK